MSDNFAEQHRNTSFSNNVTATLREEPGIYGMLAGTSDDYTGNSKSRITNRFGRLKMQDKGSRNGDTNNTDISSTTRWIKPGRLNTVAPLADLEDFQETMVDLGSPLVKEVADAGRTYHDDMFFTGFFGNGYEGEGGDDVVPFKAANIIPHGGAGLVLNKLIAARELARKRHAPFSKEPPIVLLQPEDESALLKVEEYKNSRYSGTTPLVGAEIKPFMGFRFLPFTADAESLPKSWSNFFTNGGATRRLPMIFPSGMHRGKWVEFMGKITQRDDKDFAWQYWGSARSAAVRTDEDLCFIIETQ
ncbi:phage capsid protein [Novosphingobium clariflavum]|uniref:Phage capsid protein n=1 Tax=Novosphingobium clariflavum TaxID=2029884 RepID=A0ABV6S1V3_9SPHN|nr:phage capsid protein [Novosphingobium clariflavum]